MPDGRDENANTRRTSDESTTAVASSLHDSGLTPSPASQEKASNTSRSNTIESHSSAFATASGTQARDQEEPIAEAETLDLPELTTPQRATPMREPTAPKKRKRAPSTSSSSEESPSGPRRRHQDNSRLGTPTPLEISRNKPDGKDAPPTQTCEDEDVFSLPLTLEQRQQRQREQQRQQQADLEARLRDLQASRSRDSSAFPLAVPQEQRPRASSAKEKASHQGDKAYTQNGNSLPHLPRPTPVTPSEQIVTSTSSAPRPQDVRSNVIATLHGSRPANGALNRHTPERSNGHRSRSRSRLPKREPPQVISPAQFTQVQGRTSTRNRARAEKFGTLYEHTFSRPLAQIDADIAANGDVDGYATSDGLQDAGKRGGAKPGRGSGRGRGKGRGGGRGRGQTQARKQDATQDSGEDQPEYLAVQEPPPQANKRGKRKGAEKRGM
ncbi:hypothetical protein F5Y15DRAFT_425376 [Xylariaceae sp. FL0016]|nr:hypothetical protein F5Y15DRAFT_425376 [Xylariaceae sp. FL0016]